MNSQQLGAAAAITAFVGVVTRTCWYANGDALAREDGDPRLSTVSPGGT